MWAVMLSSSGRFAFVAWSFAWAAARFVSGGLAEGGELSPLDGYDLVWSDEFDGDGPVDGSKWIFEEGFVRNRELQWYQPENAFRENGLLVIEGRRERVPNPNHVEGADDWRRARAAAEFTSSSIKTRGKFSFLYGRMEVRAKVSNEPGTWPAIWTLGEACRWPSNGEIDVMENYKGDILGNFAWGGRRANEPVWDAERVSVESLGGAAWAESFHVWTLDWTPDRLAIYLDGALVNAADLEGVRNAGGECAGQNPFRQPHYILLNLALGGNAGEPLAEGFPTRYLVDYVRVYQLAKED